MRDDRHADAGSFQLASPAALRELANVVLRQVGLIERTTHAMLARGLPARAIVAAIVGIVAVHDNGEAALGGERRQSAVEFVLAVVAAIRRVGAILGAFELGGVNDFVREAEVVRNRQREPAVRIRITRAVGGDGERA